jgi:hypothetical protein
MSIAYSAERRMSNISLVLHRSLMVAVQKRLLRGRIERSETAVGLVCDLPFSGIHETTVSE